MSRHSVLCRDNGARHYVATRLCARDKDALFLYSVALLCIEIEKTMIERQTKLGVHDRPGL